MGRKYYCDYCDKLLQYSVEARKKHTSGHQHVISKKKYYDQFKTATEKLNEELQKTKCRKFHSGQICSFGDNCIFSHLTNADIDKLTIESKQKHSAVTQNPSELKERMDTDVLELIQGTVTKGTNSSKFYVDKLFMEYHKPNPNFFNQVSLPPSLKPFTVNDLLDSQFSEWG